MKGGEGNRVAGYIASFLEGYGERERTDGDDRRRKLYRLLLGFLNSYVWSVGYDDTAAFGRERAETLALMREYVETI